MKIQRVAFMRNSGCVYAARFFVFRKIKLNGGFKLSKTIG